MKNKECPKCKETKPLSDFYKAKQYKYGVDYYCKYCRNGQSIKSFRRHKSKKSCTAGMDNCTNPHYSNGMCKNCYERNRRNGNPNPKNKKNISVYTNGLTYEQARNLQLKKKYKLTIEKFEEMSKDGCHICKRHGSDWRDLDVDHDHKCCDTDLTCGLCVRGALCGSCNSAVGMFENGTLRSDYPKREAIILYISMHDSLISDRISHYDEEQGNRNG